jgi:hypothetical protein
VPVPDSSLGLPGAFLDEAGDRLCETLARLELSDTTFARAETNAEGGRF